MSSRGGYRGVRSFDTIDHGWLVKFVEHRIGDRRVVRLIQKWLNAGVLEDGKRTTSEVGTVQGGSISPLLANIYLHYVFDLWVQRWRTHAHNDVIVVRYADDTIVGFQHREEAVQFLAELSDRLATFGLELHPGKTRIVPFGPRAWARWRVRRGQKPGTFDFLGFTHISGTSRSGKYGLRRKTMRKRWQAKLREVKAELRRRMHHTIPEQTRYLRSVVDGHCRYYGVPGNTERLAAFRFHVVCLWRRSLARRSQKGTMTWAQINRYASWLPPPRIYHPWPSTRFDVRPKAGAGCVMWRSRLCGEDASGARNDGVAAREFAT